MTTSPFDIFLVRNLFHTQFFILNNIHINGILIIIIFLVLAYLLRVNNLIHNIIFFIYNILSNLLNITDEKNNEEYMCFFFTIFLFMLISNFLGRMPGLLPINSLLKVSLPIHFLMLMYFIYHSIKKNGIKFIEIFFDKHMHVSIRYLIGIIEIISFLAKIFTFSMRLLANLTAGHVLMWVIESFITKISFYGKILPFLFLVLIYLIEFFSALLQSYVFIILSINTFRHIQQINH
jgi:F-type H+-transporting ATPase subunit a